MLDMFRNQLPSLLPRSFVQLLPAGPPNVRYANHEQGGQTRTAKTIKGVLETCGSRNIVVKGKPNHLAIFIPRERPAYTTIFTTAKFDDTTMRTVRDRVP